MPKKSSDRLSRLSFKHVWKVLGAFSSAATSLLFHCLKSGKPIGNAKQIKRSSFVEAFSILLTVEGSTPPATNTITIKTATFKYVALKSVLREVIPIEFAELDRLPQMVHLIQCLHAVVLQ